MEKKSQTSVHDSKVDFQAVVEYEEIEYVYEEDIKNPPSDYDSIVDDEEERDVFEDELKTVKQRCVRRKKYRRICFGSEGEEEEEEEEEYDEYEEEDEDWEEEEDECGELDDYSEGSSVLDSIFFEWEGETYEFEELCDRGVLQNAFTRYYVQPMLVDRVGRARYLHICEALSVTPIVRFLDALTTREVDLSYRSIDSRNIRAMCAALEINTFVERLILKANKLVEEDCHYLGVMLYYNETITELDLSGCRIGPENVKLLVESMCINETLEVLNLSKCNIQDEGMQGIAKVLCRNNSIKVLDVSYNKLGDKSAEALGLALKVNECLTRLNLCYNNLYDAVAMKTFFRGMTQNQSVTHLILAWNAISRPELGKYIKVFLRKNSNIKYLDLSDNRLEGVAVTAIKNGLSKSQSLEVLKLGKNPIAPDTLEAILNAAKNCTTLKVLDLEELWVKKSFDRTLKRIKQNRDLQVIIGGVYSNYEIKGPDYPRLILKRAKYEAMKPKKAKKRKDFGHFIWSLGDEPLSPDEFMTRVKKFKAKIKKDLFPELIKQFLIPKVNLIDVVAMREKYLSIFPDSTPAPPKKSDEKKAIPESESLIKLKTESEEAEPEETEQEVEAKETEREVEAKEEDYLCDEETDIEFATKLYTEEEEWGYLGREEESYEESEIEE